ncbi:MAG: hypothetical protein ABSB76_18010 [Streptosporangiaceae bacterium]
MDADGAGTLTGLATEERLRAGDLIAELNARARRIGLNTTDWPGLTMYRFEAPVIPQWSEVHAPAGREQLSAIGFSFAASDERMS